MTWDFQYGREFDEEVEEKILKALEPSYIAGLTLLGGEPMEYVNQQGILPLLRKVKEKYPDKTIWCYTGYLYEKDILENFCAKWAETEEILSYLDVMVDGEFVEDLKDISLRFRGSSNQRIIDVKKSRQTEKIILWDDGN
jgi:anaerobic ribonucleoside-triphosphate reductase activating protein